MAQIFISHSKDDIPGKNFLQPYFAASKTEAFFYGWRGPTPPHAPALKNAIKKSVGMIVLMSDYLSHNLHTAAWTSYEIGIANALNIPVIQLEPIIKRFDSPTSPKKLPVAHIDYLIYYDPESNISRDTAFQSIIDAASSIILLRRKEQYIPYKNLVSALDKYCTAQIACQNIHCRAKWKAHTRSSVYICPVCRRMYNSKGKGFSEIRGRGDYTGVPETYAKYRTYQGADLCCRVDTIHLQSSLKEREKDEEEWDCYDYKIESSKSPSKRKKS
jgi:hypothetical protein